MLGATFARLIQLVFDAQVRRNPEAYMDNIIVKSKDEQYLFTPNFGR